MIVKRLAVNRLTTSADASFYEEKVSTTAAFRLTIIPVQKRLKCLLAKIKLFNTQQ